MEPYGISSSQLGRAVFVAKPVPRRRHVSGLHYVTVLAICGAGYSGALPKKAGVAGVARWRLGGGAVIT
jgi:hypothetical protein